MVKQKIHRPRGAQDMVYSTLRTSIINLNLAPGTSISETEISQKIKVSRTPVREAFIHLSKEGLIEVIPQKGTLVSLIDPARVKQEFFIRESLETAALDKFLLNNGSRYFTEMENLIDLQSAALKSKAYIEFINQDDRFHQILLEAADQHLSWEVLSSMCGHYHRIRMLTIWMEGIGDEKVAEHRKILTALQKEDIENAKKTLYLHLHNLDTEENLVRKIFPEFFSCEDVKTAFDVDFGGFPVLQNSKVQIQSGKLPGVK